MNAEMTLDEAWAAAEAALPADWMLELRRTDPGDFTAIASLTLFGRSEGYVDADATTHTAALIALTARLQEQPR